MQREVEPVSDAFTRKTRRGNVVSVLREHYFRNDVWCHSDACRTCAHDKTRALSATAPRYVAFDSVVAASYTDLLEHGIADDLVLIQTVAEETKERASARVFSRVRGMTSLSPSAKNVRCAFLANEHSAAMYVRREHGESQQQRIARAVLKACQWLSSHLAGAIPVVVLCEDPVLRQLAASSPGPVEVVSCAQFVAKYRKGDIELAKLVESLDAAAAAASAAALLVASQTSGSATRTKAQGTEFSPYLPDSALDEGVLRGTMFRGKLHVNGHDTSEAEIHVSGAKGIDAILVVGRENMNRAVHEDNVVVELLPRALWKAPSEAVSTPSSQGPEPSKVAAAATISSEPTKGALPCGRVVGVTRRNWRPYVATMPEEEAEAASGNQQCAVLVVPFDRRIPKIRVRTRQAADLSSSRIVVAIDSWEVDSSYPNGHFVKELGPIGRIETEVAATLVENQISCPPFTPALFDTLPVNTPHNPWRIPAEEVQKRRDMRASRVYCLTTDHQILTNRGFFFLDEFQKLEPAMKATRANRAAFFQFLLGMRDPRSQVLPLPSGATERIFGLVTAGECPLRVAAFDKGSGGFRWRIHKLIVNEPLEATQRLLRFEDKDEACRWGEISDKHGRRIGETTVNANHAPHSCGISLTVTEDHRMFVQMMAHADPDGRVAAAAPETVTAGQLVDCMAINDQVRFFACAPAGLLHTSVPLASGLARCDSDPKIHAFMGRIGLGALDVTTQDQFDAFLELYGMLIGKGEGLVNCVRVRGTDSESNWIQRHLRGIGFVEGIDYTVVSVADGQFNISISKTELSDSHFVGFAHVTRKRLPEWVWDLAPQQMKRIAAGLLCIDEPVASGHIATTSVDFRDELVLMLTLSGCSVHFRLDQSSRANEWVVSFIDGTSTASATRPTISRNEITVVDGSGEQTWCVSVPPEGLVYARRAHRDECGVVTRASRGVVVGNSIDPPGCKDIDDALSIDKNADGTFTVGVHIADPSYFVVEGNLLDREARSRSTTVYLPHTRFNMIPSELSEDLCSLHQGHDKLAISVVYQVSAAFEVTSEWFGRTVVRSVHSLSYEQAQAILDKSPSAPPFEDAELLRKELRVLMLISRKLKAARVARGALELHSEEVGFQLERSTNAPLQIRPHDDLEVNSLVEEFMILANESVARRIQKAFPSVALLRRHVLPSQNRFRQLVKCAEAAGITLDTSSNKALAKSLNAAAVPGSPHATEILKTLATRAMSEAEYFCTGICEPALYYHYGLASEYYTHFTSPIRRYADIVVHRLLVKAIAGESTPGMTTAELQAMADHMNHRHHASRRAQKDAMLLFQVFYFAERDVTADAVVYSVRKNALLVHVPQFSLKGTVYLLDRDGGSMLPLPDCPSELVPASDISIDVEKQAVTIKFPGSPKGVVLRPFDQIRVRIETEQSRSHKPDVKLRIVSLPEGGAQGNHGKQQQVGKRELVTSVFDQQKPDAPSSSPPRSAGPSQRQSLYDFLQKLSKSKATLSPVPVPVLAPAPEIVQPKQPQKGKKSKGKKEVSPAESGAQRAEDKTMRRWALTPAQIRKLEELKTPTAQPSWLEDAEEGGESSAETSAVDQDTSRRGLMEERAMKQVRDAAHARFKQHQQKRK